MSLYDKLKNLLTEEEKENEESETEKTPQTQTKTPEETPEITEIFQNLIDKVGALEKQVAGYQEEIEKYKKVNPIRVDKTAMEKLYNLTQPKEEPTLTEWAEKIDISKIDFFGKEIDYGTGQPRT